LISCTCDAWQAANVDGYFAVTSHWLKKKPGEVLTLRNTLLGFVCLNGAHSGKRLGQTLFKVFDHVGAISKVRIFAFFITLPSLYNDAIIDWLGDL
jgi:hypothetical protein